MSESSGAWPGVAAIGALAAKGSRRGDNRELPQEGRSSTPGPPTPTPAPASSLRSSAVAHSPAGATIRDRTTGDSINGSGSRADSAGLEARRPRAGRRQRAGRRARRRRWRRSIPAVSATFPPRGRGAARPALGRTGSSLDSTSITARLPSSGLLATRRRHVPVWCTSDTPHRLRGRHVTACRATVPGRGSAFPGHPGRTPPRRTPRAGRRLEQEEGRGGRVVDEGEAATRPRPGDAREPPLFPCSIGT